MLLVMTVSSSILVIFVLIEGLFFAFFLACLQGVFMHSNVFQLFFNANIMLVFLLQLNSL